MAAVIENVLTEALTLSANERAALVEALVRSLDRPDNVLDALWVAEARRRMLAYERGEMPAYDADDVLKAMDSVA